MFSRASCRRCGLSAVLISVFLHNLGQNLTWPVACQTSLLPRSLRGEISLSGSRDRPVRAPGLAARSRATSRATNSRLVTTLVYCTGNMTCS